MKSVPLSQFMPYGAPELLGSSRRHMMQALMLSTGLCAASFAVIGVVLMRMPHPIVLVAPVVHPPAHPLLPPPSIRPLDQAAQPVIAKPQFAIPIPVPLLDPRRLLDSIDLPTVDTGALARLGEPDHGAGSRGTEANDVPPSPPPLPKRGEYVRFDVLPEVLKQVDPEYPEIAKMAGVEGHVLVEVLVGRDGHIVDAVVSPKASIGLLNDAALAAAHEWVFKPALADGHPVAVWVAVPFRFKLH